jgi:hypothetical protein
MPGIEEDRSSITSELSEDDTPSEIGLEPTPEDRIHLHHDPVVRRLPLRIRDVRTVSSRSPG